MRNPESFVAMVGAGIITPQIADEQKARAQLGLDPLDDDAAPSGFDRLAAAAGGRQNTEAGQREARRPGAAPATVNRLVERGVTPPETDT